jgi:hypothetical protein
MANFILPNAEFKSYDVSSANQSVTLTAVIGKQYIVGSYGTDNGYHTAVTYGSASLNITTGDMAMFIYDGANWFVLS